MTVPGVITELLDDTTTSVTTTWDHGPTRAENARKRARHGKTVTGQRASHGLRCGQQLGYLRKTAQNRSREECSMVMSVTRLSIEDARILLQGAAQKSAEIGVPMCTAVCDDTGMLLAFEREDGGKPTSVSIAIDKAFTSAGARRPTRFYGENTIPQGPTWGIHTTNGGRFCVIPGGLPVVIEGAVVGGVGCSSGTGDEDEVVAQAAIDHLLSETGLDGA